MTQTFRRVCGVKGNEWPNPELVRINPTTGVAYLAPIFESKVTDFRNNCIIVEVATQVDAEMKVSSSQSNLKGNPLLTRIAFKLKRPPGVSKTAVWDRTMLITMSKASFRSCKQGWMKIQDSAAAESKD